LWHGANWTFIVWGTIHGLGLAIERALRAVTGGIRQRGILASFVRRLIVFHLVCLAWVFFRSPSLHGALALLDGLGSWVWQPVYATALLFLGAVVAMMLAVDVQIERSEGEYLSATWPLAFRVVTGVAFCSIVTLLGANQASAFIYFQF
jgi:D-alanyl-lipoteichoic acid acyltransferase DltB (MBOAT superfamily)